MLYHVSLKTVCLNLTKKDRGNRSPLLMFLRYSRKCPTPSVSHIHKGKPFSESPDTCTVLYWEQQCAAQCTGDLALCAKLSHAFQYVSPLRKPCLAGLKLGHLLLVVVMQCQVFSGYWRQTEQVKTLVVCVLVLLVLSEHWHLTALRSLILSLSENQMRSMFVLKNRLKEWSEYTY